jgi:hypothetical protein
MTTPILLPPLPEPYGRVTTHTVTGQQFFYRHPEPPYLDTAKEVRHVFLWEDVHAHLTAKIAAEDAALREVLEFIAGHDLNGADDRAKAIICGLFILKSKAALKGASHE